MSVKEISPTEAFEMLQAYDDAVMIDVRNREEWRRDGIPKVNKDSLLLVTWPTDGNAKDLDDFVHKIRSLVPETDSKLVFICAGGIRSLDAAELMLDVYDNCYSVEGGMWVNDLRSKKKDGLLWDCQWRSIMTLNSYADLIEKITKNDITEKEKETKFDDGGIPVDQKESIIKLDNDEEDESLSDKIENDSDLENTYSLTSSANSEANSDVEKDISSEILGEFFTQIALPHLKNKYGADSFSSWLKCLSFKSNTGDSITIGTSSKIKKEWIISHGVDSEILALYQGKYSNISSIVLVLTNKKKVEIKSISSNSENLMSENDIDMNESDSNMIFKSSLDTRFTFDNFVVGKPNELAFSAAKRIAESSSPVSGSNPLFLYGGVGLGKTHLMHAIGNYVTQNFKDRKVVYLSAEKFMYQYIISLRNKNIMLFKERLRSLDILMVDDVQFISGKDSTQEEFFHTFNSLIDQKKQLIISADRSPSDLHGVEERIRSRLGWGLVADIHESTFELRLGILQSKITSMGINIPNKVLSFIARNVTSNIRELEGALNKVVAHSSLVGRGINMETTEEILFDLLRSNAKIITIEDIQNKVSEYYNVKVSDMRSRKRVQSIARARQVAMYLAKKFTPSSLVDIGKHFGGKDHATVIHSIKRIEYIMKKDSGLMEDIEMISKKIK